MTSYRSLLSRPRRSGARTCAAHGARPRRLARSARLASAGVFDVGSLERLARTNPAMRLLLIALVKDACEQLPRELALARAYAAQGDYAAAAACLHSARGISAVVGAKWLARATLDAELLLKSVTSAPSPHYFALVDAALAATLTHAHAWLDGAGEQSAPAQTGHERR